MINARVAYYFHPVHDIKLAYTFFKEVMGFSLTFGHFTEANQELLGIEELENVQWLEFDCGNFTMLVQHVPSIKPYETGLGFQVDNCDEAYVFFKNNNVEIVSPIQGIGTKNRFFEIKDPTGSIFNIFGN
jgi:predicted enzyme related to lactoylglutathione lyase